MPVMTLIATPDPEPYGRSGTFPSGLSMVTNHTGTPELVMTWAMGPDAKGWPDADNDRRDPGAERDAAEDQARRDLDGREYGGDLP